MAFDALVFDLDGTLWDTCPACAVAWNEVLARHSIEYRRIEPDDVRKVTGRPHEECIRLTFADLSPSQIQILVDDTTVEDGVAIERLGGEIYEGVEAGLRILSEKYRLFIVSNCQSGYIETFLRLSGFGKFFDDFECWGNTGCPKSENLRRVIERNKLVSPVMVGDTPGDQKAAIDCGIPFAFVSYGFQSCDAPEFSFDSFGGLVSQFMSPHETRL